MKIYTRTGDKGTTSLVGGTRIAKDHQRLQSYGTIDELNSWLGLVAATAGTVPVSDGHIHNPVGLLPARDAQLLTRIQNKLFDLGTELATEPDSKWQPKGIQAADVEWLEAAIDRVDATLPAHNRFILPGGTPASAQAQIARTVARRAERQMITLSAQVPVSENAIRFINRLSDYLFILARQLNNLAHHPETFWDHNV